MIVLLDIRRRFFIFGVILLLNAAQPLNSADVSIINKSDNNARKAITGEAVGYIGVPYVSGGSDRKGFDCSGLIYRVFHDVSNLDVPRTLEELAAFGIPVKSDLYAADILLFDTDGKGKASHAGISLGGNKFIHAASKGSKRGVIVSALTEEYYGKRYMGSRRIIRDDFPCIRVVFDNLSPVYARFQENILLGFPVFVELENRQKQALIVSFKVYREGKLSISKRMKLANNGDIASTWFIPDNGKWSISIEDQKQSELVGIRLF